MERSVCEHPKRVLAVRHEPNGCPFYYEQCVECGDLKRPNLRNLTKADYERAVPVATGSSQPMTTYTDPTEAFFAGVEG